MKDSEVQWFRPLWLRVLVVAFIVAWFCWEAFYNHDQLWMIITAAAFAYAVWNLFIRFDARSAAIEAGKPKQAAEATGAVAPPEAGSTGKSDAEPKA